MDPFDPSNPPNAYYSPAPQVQRHEIARIRQFINELEYMRGSLMTQLNLLATQVSTADKQMQYVQLLNAYQTNEQNLQQQANLLSQMLTMAGADSQPRTLSEQTKREIYHLYQSGRYKQEELADQYVTSQATVSRIVKGDAPAPLQGVNPNSLT